MNRNILSFLIISLLCVSCKKEKLLTFSEVEITTKTNTLVSVVIPKASSKSNTSAAINKKIEEFVTSTLTVGNSEPDKKYASIAEQIDAFNTEYTNFIKDFPESSSPWEAQIDGELMYQSDEVVSIAITSYINTGGAHGNTAISFLNFDTSNGKQITNKALFKDIKALQKLAKPFFDAEVKDKSILFEPKTFSLPANIGFSDDGLILLYNTYEIAPYASGIIEFKIPFEKINDYLVFNGS